MTRGGRLRDVIAAAGPTHHAAFRATDGDDPEWPLWYAKHLVEDVRVILERPELTVSRLVWALVAADDAYRRTGPPEPWPDFYARRLAADLG